jgi:DNA-binding NarL/FixJ family response regulator
MHRSLDDPRTSAPLAMISVRDGESAVTASAAQPLEIVVVEDHAAVRLGIEAILQRAGHTVVAATDSVEAARTLVLEHQPGVALLDVNLSSGDGIELARTLLERQPERRILLYTGFADDCRLGEALAFGVRGVALKAGDPAELIQAVATVASDGVYLDPRLREVLGQFGTSQRRRVLSKREAEVFALLAQGHTGEDIADRLVLSGETVRTHVRNGMRRLGARTRAHAVAMALSSGEITG